MKKISYVLSAVIVFVMMICIVLIFVTDMPYGGNGKDGLADFSEGWTYPDGSPADLSDIPKERRFEIRHDFLRGEDAVSLCFRSKNVDLSVYIGDEMIYDFHPQIPALYGNSYGKFVHSIRLPYTFDADALRIVVEPAYGDGSERIFAVCLDRSDVYCSTVLGENMLVFVICMITAFLGLLFVVAGMIYTLRAENRIQTVSLGLLAILSGIWEGTETPVLQMLTGNAAACHFINYLCLMFVAIPACNLIANLAHSDSSRVVRIIDAAVILNFVVQVICSLTGVADYHTLLTATHAVIAAGIGVSVFLVIRAIKRDTIDKKRSRIILIAFSALALAGLADIILYRMGHAYGSVFMLGILIFVLYLGYFELLELIAIAEKDSYAKKMFRLAHTDGLTGLENRLAFGEYEQSVSSETDGEYTIVQFDINDLKKVNDFHGHMAGDAHIRAAAEIIRRNFCALGHVFRTGGDEFIAIFPRRAVNDMDKLIQSFRGDIDKYNRDADPPVKLVVACGYSHYTCGSRISDAEIIADNLMYENKKLTKEQNK
ncbi:MAG: GGDEF domain-containing protein [Ruminiclostridium sp.]|nr:GGDEF domain-containing protein [Ruminiclostridium sp.]